MSLPRIQHQAPGFTAQAIMPNKEFKNISLSDYAGNYVVLFFYPLDFTFVCPTEIIAFGDRQSDFAKLNTQLIAASCDSHFTHLAWCNTARSEGGLGSMQIPIIADFDKKVATDYGVLLDGGVPLRGLFIIGPTGVLRHMTVNDLPVGRNVDEILRLVAAFQHTDVHGEVCPANWTPGAKTMVADPVQSKKYFNTLTDDSSAKKRPLEALTTTAAAPAASTASYNPTAPAAAAASSAPPNAPATVATATAAATGEVVASDKLEAVDDADEFGKLTGDGRCVTVVDFWAPWCHNCKRITPIVERLAGEYGGRVRFVKVNADEVEEVAQACEVQAMPTLQFYKGGKRLGVYMGSDPAKVEAAIRKNIADGNAN